MASLDKFSCLQAEYLDCADFLTIYIAEAHPVEKGFFNGNFDIKSHNTLQDRIAAAETLRQEAKDRLKHCPILVDGMENLASKSYAALPERLYVVFNGIIIYEGGMGPFGYNIAEVEEVLNKYK